MLPTAPSPTIELVPTILRSALARDTATVNPTMLSSQSLGGDSNSTYPIIYSLFEQSSLGLLGPSSQTHQSTDPASEPPETSSDIDMSWCFDEQAFWQDMASETNLVPSFSGAWARTTGPNIQATPPSPAHTVSHRQAQHAEFSMTRTDSQRRTPSRPSKRRLIRGMIDDCLTQERIKRMTENLTPPDDDYLRPEVQDRIIGLEDEFFATVLVKIAGPQQIVALREVICNERNHRDLRPFLFMDEMSLGKRLGVIIGLDKKLAATQLLRWYHILRLFEDCGGRDALSSSGNMNTTPATFSTEKQGRGNPVHKRDSLVAKTMVHHCFPRIPPDSDDFKSKLGVMKRIRQLGKRLHMLTEKFRPGVLGLIFDLNTRSDTLATADCR